MALKLFRSDSAPADPTPAYSALLAHRAELAKLREESAAWGSKESAEVQHVQTYSDAQAALAQLEQARVDAQADAEVLGHTDVDVTALAREIEAARNRVGILRDRAELAAAKVRRIREQREKLRAQIEELNTHTRELQHAARLARLASAMETLLEAEKHYVGALEEAYGIAAAIDELAKAPGVQLPFAGQLPIGELLLPRPFHTDFANRPQSMRPDIAQAVAAVSERIAQEL